LFTTQRFSYPLVFFLGVTPVRYSCRFGWSFPGFFSFLFHPHPVLFLSTFSALPKSFFPPATSPLLIFSGDPVCSLIRLVRTLSHAPLPGFKFVCYKHRFAIFKDLPLPLFSNVAKFFFRFNPDRNIFSSLSFFYLGKRFFPPDPAGLFHPCVLSPSTFPGGDLFFFFLVSPGSFLISRGTPHPFPPPPPTHGCPVSFPKTWRFPGFFFRPFTSLRVPRPDPEGLPWSVLCTRLYSCFFFFVSAFRA